MAVLLLSLLNFVAGAVNHESAVTADGRPAAPGMGQMPEGEFGRVSVAGASKLLMYTAHLATSTSHLAPRTSLQCSAIRL